MEIFLNESVNFRFSAAADTIVIFSFLVADGFLKFNPNAANNLIKILARTNAAIVLTTTHRVNYSIDAWTQLFQARNIYASSISKINNLTTLGSMPDRATEVNDWVGRHGKMETFVVIDDDTSLNRLSQDIKDKIVFTKPLAGLDDEATEKVLAILLG